MRFAWFKYLMVVVCAFAVLQSAGISVTSLSSKSYTHHSDCLCDAGDDDATERNETKESNLKEYWAIYQQLDLPVLFAYISPAQHPGKLKGMHLAWIAPVPTPPPNFLV